jgi:hypothetical protein
MRAHLACRGVRLPLPVGCTKGASDVRDVDRLLRAKLRRRKRFP